MINVFSSQFNYQYGRVIHFPYSIASIIAYIKSFAEINSNFSFQKTFVFRNKLDDYILKSSNVDILLCSCYTWNWEITNILARSIKKSNPNCLIIYGGPQVPLRYEGDVPKKWVDKSEGSFFKDYPYVDILVHQEGEYIVKEIFFEFLKNKDFSKIQGIETKDYKTLPAERVQDLDTLPSPYLTNLVWDLVEPVEGVDYIASWETNRGCPYQCAYCDWGSSTKSKVRKRDINILLKEIEWFADNKIPYVDICDANFGIFSKRDLQLAEKFKEQKLEKGYPGRVGIAWAKSSTNKIIPIAQALLEADLLRAVTLAVQSLNPETLDIIQRSNIKFDVFSNLVQQFRHHRIENYTEIIMGMPGETLESFKNGLEQLMELFPRPVIFIYNCGIFVNAPMNDPDYIKLHGIKVIKSPIYLWHSSIYNRGNIAEYDNIAVCANSFTTDDLKQMYVYGWMTQSFHSLGITEYISKFYNQVYNLKYIEFYSFLLQFSRHSDGLFHNELQILSDYMNTGYAGLGWDHYDPNLAPIFWPIEEATWLRCVEDSAMLCCELFNFLLYLEQNLSISTSHSILEDLVKFQVFLLSTMDNKEISKRHVSTFNWKDFFENNIRNIVELTPCNSEYSWKNKVTLEDKSEWCYRAIWLGRNQGNYKCHPEFLEVRSLSCDSNNYQTQV